MDTSKSLGQFPRELLRWVTYSVLYDGRVVNDEISMVLNDPEPKEEYFCFRGLRCESPNKKLIQAPQHPFNDLAYTEPDVSIVDKKQREYKKFDYSLLDSPSISEQIVPSQLKRLVGFIAEVTSRLTQLVQMELPLKIERRLYLNLLDLMGQSDTVLYTNLLHRLVPSKIVSN